MEEIERGFTGGKYIIIVPEGTENARKLRPEELRINYSGSKRKLSDTTHRVFYNKLGFIWYFNQGAHKK